MTDSQVDFLMQRITEDSNLALKSIRPEEMHPYGDKRLPAEPPSSHSDMVEEYLGGTWGEHYANWNPTRVIAECEAKSQIIDFYKELSSRDLKGDIVLAAMFAILGEVILAMLQVYSNHPDFPAEWIDN